MPARRLNFRLRAVPRVGARCCPCGDAQATMTHRDFFGRHDSPAVFSDGRSARRSGRTSLRNPVIRRDVATLKKPRGISSSQADLPMRREKRDRGQTYTRLLQKAGRPDRSEIVRTAMRNGGPTPVSLSLCDCDIPPIAGFSSEKSTQDSLNCNETASVSRLRRVIGGTCCHRATGIA